MKTNHQRNFKDTRDYSVTGALEKAWNLGAVGNDFTKGKHGIARNKKGRKKFVISRLRFKLKSETRKILNEPN